MKVLHKIRTARVERGPQTLYENKMYSRHVEKDRVFQ